MYKIDLIKERALTKGVKDKFAKTAVIAGIVFGVFLLVMIAYFIALSVRTGRYKSEADKVKSEVRQIYERHNMDEWESEWTQLYRIGKVVESVFSGRRMHSKELSYILGLLPDDVNIQKISSNSDIQRLSFDIIALPEDDMSEKINDFVNSLKEQDIFPADVEVSDEREISVEGERVKFFNIMVNFGEDNNG